MDSSHKGPVMRKAYHASKHTPNIKQELLNKQSPQIVCCAY